MRIAVAGAGGFIGGHLCKRLVEEGHLVTAIDIKPFDQWWQVYGEHLYEKHDLSDPDACHVSMHGKFDEVYNLAASMGGMGMIQTQQLETGLNVLISTNVIERASQVSDRYLYSSSACVYPEYRQDSTGSAALREEDAWPAQPQDMYGIEKLFSEEVAKRYASERGLDIRLPRFHAIYGPHGTFVGGREKAPAAICRKVISAKLSGNHTVDVWGDGEQERSFCYIDDCVEGMVRLMASGCQVPINIGSSELVTINQLVDVVADIAGISVSKTYDLSAPQGVRGRNSDNSFIREALHWEPSISLREGLDKTYAWIWDQMNG